MRSRDVLGLTIVSGSLLVAQPRQALACGGCFHPPTPVNMSTVVTGHRMAFAFSSTRTVLWDQIQYSGNPTDFSWVLPVKGDAKLEAAEDAWFESLEAVSHSVTSPPHLDCYVSSSSGDGCSCGSVSDSVPTRALAASGPGGFITGGVVVVHEGTVGPYQFVQLRAADSESLLKWLPDNNYVIPPDIKPVIEAYQNEQFDFVALKLAPGMGIRQMTPVRVVTPGASPVLPLRMVAAGTGDFVDIVLYVISEGRYEAAGFNNNVTIDFSKLTWDWHGQFDSTQGESNYAALRLQALAAGDGKNWLTSFAAHPGFTQTYTDALGQALTFSTNNAMPSGFSPTAPFTNLTDLYFAQASLNAGTLDICSANSTISGKLKGHLQVVDTCVATDLDSGTSPSTDAGSPDSGRLTTCSSAPAGKLAASSLACSNFSDISAALIGMYTDDVWITRLEANLPHAALAADLKITPAKDQTEVSSAHQATQHLNPPCDLIQNHPDIEVTVNALSSDARMQQAGVGAFTALGLLVARRTTRRRARRK